MERVLWVNWWILRSIFSLRQWCFVVHVAQGCLLGSAWTLSACQKGVCLTSFFFSILLCFLFSWRKYPQARSGSKILAVAGWQFPCHVAILNIANPMFVSDLDWALLKETYCDSFLYLSHIGWLDISGVLADPLPEIGDGAISDSSLTRKHLPHPPQFLRFANVKSYFQTLWLDVPSYARRTRAGVQTHVGGLLQLQLQLFEFELQPWVSEAATVDASCQATSPELLRDMEVARMEGADKSW